MDLYSRRVVMPSSPSRIPLLPMLVATGLLGWLGLVVPVLARTQLRHTAPVIWWVAVVGFLACYLVAAPGTDRPRTALRRSAAIALPVLAVVAVSAWSADGVSPVLFTITMGTAGFVLGPRIVMLLLVIQSVVLLLVMPRQGLGLEWPAVYIAVNCFAALMIEIAVRESHSRQAVQQTAVELRHANLLLARRSRDEERVRIARDLHDTLGHQLTALTLNLEVASHLVQGPAAPHVEQSRELAKGILADIRAVVSEMRDRLGLAEELRRLAERIPEPLVEIEVDPALEGATGEVADVVIWIAQEGLTNAVRHAGARLVHLEVRQERGWIVMHVRDDGAGAADLSIGNGLRGMSERVDAAGGTLQWETRPGQGFHLTARLRDPGSEHTPRPQDEPARRATREGLPRLDITPRARISLADRGHPVDRTGGVAPQP